MGVTFSHFVFKVAVKKNVELRPSEGWLYLAGGELWDRVCINITVLGFHEPSSSEERDFSRVAGSASGHLPLCPLADRCSVVYQLQRTIEFPSLQGSP